MYKDYKKSESLDTGFVGGSGILWMFSGIVLGLLVGLGMYYFSNGSNSSFSTVANVQQSIEAAQNVNSSQSIIKTSTKTTSLVSKQSVSKEQLDKTKKSEMRHNKFSYYAVLPTLDVPVNSAKPLETRPVAEIDNLDKKELEAIQKKVALLNGAIDEQDLVERITEQKPGDYLLQVASFRKKSKANLTKGRLAKRGVEAYIKQRKIKGRLWYRVLAGPLDQSSIDNWKSQAEKLGHRPLVISVR